MKTFKALKDFFVFELDGTIPQGETISVYEDENKMLVSKITDSSRVISENLVITDEEDIAWIIPLEPNAVGEESELLLFESQVADPVQEPSPIPSYQPMTQVERNALTLTEEDAYKIAIFNTRTNKEEYWNGYNFIGDSDIIANNPNNLAVGMPVTSDSMSITAVDGVNRPNLKRISTQDDRLNMIGVINHVNTDTNTVSVTTQGLCEVLLLSPRIVSENLQASLTDDGAEFTLNLNRFGLMMETTSDSLGLARLNNFSELF